jgi:hypothetical protein
MLRFAGSAQRLPVMHFKLAHARCDSALARIGLLLGLSPGTRRSSWRLSSRVSPICSGDKSAIGRVIVPIVGDWRRLPPNPRSLATGAIHGRARRRMAVTVVAADVAEFRQAVFVDGPPRCYRKWLDSQRESTQ